MTKLCNVQNTIAQYERHVADGSFPASIRNSIKDPKIQYSKKFLGTTEGALIRHTTDAIVQDGRKNILKFVLARKHEELAILQQQVAFDATTWKNQVAEVSSRVAATLGIHLRTPGNDGNPIWIGDNLLLGVRQDCNTLGTQGNIWHYRTISIARLLADRALVDKVKTLTLKAEADTKMRDTDAELTTPEMAREEMQSQLKSKLNAFKQEMLKKLGTSFPSSRQNGHLTSYRATAKARRRQRQKERRRLGQIFRHQEETGEPKERARQGGKR